MANDIDRWQEEIRWLRGLALRLVSDPEVAEDLVQETALLSLSRADVAGAKGRPWRAGVLRRLVITRWREKSRRERREACALRPAAPPSPEEIVAQVEIHRVLAEAVLALDEPSRRVIVLRYFHDRSSADIARESGEPESTVRTRLARAIERLRAALDARSGGDRRKWALPLVAWIGASAGGASGAEAMEGAGSSAPAPTGIGALATSKLAAVIAASLLVIGGGAAWLGLDDGTPVRPDRAPVVAAGIAPEEEPAPAVLADAPAAPREPGAGPWRGAVLDRTTERPIAGAVVRIGEPGGPALAVARTDAEGSFAIPDLAADASAELELRASAPSHLPVARALHRFGAVARTLSPIHLSPGFEVEGRVVDAAGNPVAGARIAAEGALVPARTMNGFEPRGDALPIDLRTDEDGRFRLALPRGEARILALAEAGIGTALLAVPVEGAGPTIELAPGNAIDGIVVGAGGEPIEGAIVLPDRHSATWPDGFGGLDALAVRTGRDGRFRLVTELPPLCLHARSPDLRRGTLALSAIASDELAVIRIDPGLTLRGRLVAGEGWSGPLPRRVELENSWRRRATVAADGAFILRGVDPDRTADVLVCGSALAIPVGWPAGAREHDLGELSLLPGRTIAVEVVDGDGLPIADATVRAIDPENALRPFAVAVTDAAGRARLAGIAEDRAVVVAWAPERCASTARIAVPAEGATLRLALAAGASATGRAVYPDGAPVAGARVALDDLGDDPIAHRWPHRDPEFLRADTTDDDGAFRFPLLPCGLPLRLAVHAPGSAATVIDLPPLAEGEALDLGEIRCGEGALLRAIVTDARGEPLPGATVELVPFDTRREVRGEPHPAVEQWTDWRGIAEFRGVAAGSHTLHAWRADSAQARELVEISGEFVERRLALVPGETWRVRVVDERGAPVAGAPLCVVSRSDWSPFEVLGFTDGDGRVAIEGLSKGGISYRIEVQGFAELNGRAEALEAAPSTLVLRRAGRIRLLFPREPGEPAHEGVAIRLRGEERTAGLTAEVDAQGSWNSGPLTPGRYGVQVSIFGFPSFEQEVEIEAGRTVELAVRPDPAATVEFEVHLEDLRGNPLEGQVVVTIRDSGLGQSRPIRRIERGVFRGRAPRGTHELVLFAHAPGFGPWRDAQFVPRAAPVVVRLEPEAVLEGVILEADGRPAAGVEIYVQSPLHVRDRGNEITGAEGRFRIARLGPGEARLDLRRNGSLGMYGALLAAGEHRQVEIRLPPTRTIAGIWSAGSGARASSARVHGGGWSAPLTIDTEGRFQGAVPDESPVMFFIQLDQLTLVYPGVELRPGEEIRLEYAAAPVELRFAASPGVGLAGVVGSIERVDGIPRVSGSFPIREDGVALLPPLPAGRYHIGAQLPRSLALARREVELGPNATTIEVLPATRLRVIRPARGGCVADRIGPDRIWQGLDVEDPVSARGPLEIALPALAELGSVVLSGSATAPVIIDLAAGVPVEPITIPDDPGGRVIIAPWKSSGAPARLRFEPIAAPALHSVLSARAWLGEECEHPLPGGRFRVIAEDESATALEEREIDIAPGPRARVEW